MSERIQKNDNRAAIRWKLLTGASVLALIASSPVMADENADHPLLWIELGGDADAITGIDSRFTAPFLTQTPTPTPFLNGSPVELQKPSRFTFGGEGKLTFQPEDSDWVFSAGVRYGRSSNKRDTHNQTNATIKFPNPAYEHLKNNYPSYLANYPSIGPAYTKYAPKFSGTTVSQSERHLVLDFQAGKDVGLGMFGQGGTSVISGGVRVARFNTRSDVTIRARPDASFYSKTFHNPFGGVQVHSIYTIYEPHWRSYYLRGTAQRSFNGIGPSLSWNASVPVAGNVQQGELELDWGINGSVLFGKQKVKVNHHTTGRVHEPKYNHYFTTPGGGHHYDNYFSLYPPVNGHRVSSRSVTVPNLGATIGLTYRIEDAKLSLGYRADYFFGAMDTGIDAVKKTTLGFNGLYASISIGLGD